jgi:hypothetical protein
MPGPAPKPADQRKRRNAPMANTLKLPSQGREGKPPRWPAGMQKMTTDQRRLWRELWATPMAVAWERLGWTRVVARYVVTVTAAQASLESENPNAALMGETRQLEDRLGMTPMAMLRLRWEVTEDEVAEQRAETPKRRTLRAVDPGEAAAGGH